MSTVSFRMKFTRTLSSGCAISAAFWLGIHLSSGSAAVPYGTAGDMLNENFDSLATSGTFGATQPWANDSTLPGWHFVNASGSTPATYSIVDGSSASQNTVLSLGSLSSGDRALGFQSPGSTALGVIVSARYGVALTNTTGFTLQSFFVQYTGELWRFIGPEPAETIVFEYQIFAGGTGALTAASGWTPVAGLNFTSPNTTAGVTSLNGNLAINRTTLSQTINDFAWGNGEELWLRWTDSSTWNGNNNSSLGLHKNGIDDISFSAAVPEPRLPLLGALGVLALLARRKRRG